MILTKTKKKTKTRGNSRRRLRSYKAVLVLPDMHVPFHDRKTTAAVLEYAADEWWDECVLIGDFLDLNCISTHNTGKPRLVEGQSLGDDYAQGGAVLDAIVKAVRRKNVGCDITYLEGNHEQRVERLLDCNPVLAEVVEVPRGLELKRRGIKWVRSWSRGDVHRIGNAHFHHGLYTNLHHAKKTVEAFGVPIYYGHTHDIQGYSKVLRGRDHTIEGASLGCLCNYEQSYKRGGPDRWQQSISVFQVFPDGYFQRCTTAIFKHRIIGPTNGKVYDGRKLSA